MISDYHGGRNRLAAEARAQAQEEEGALVRRRCDAAVSQKSQEDD